MKRHSFWTVLLLLAILATVWIAHAQQRRGRGFGMPRYDTSSEVTLSGVVEKLESQIGRMGWKGTHLVVRFDTEMLTVHVGPSVYLEQQGFSFAPGDKIEVTGSKVKLDMSDVIVAREIKKGDRVLTLRNHDGIPAWSRGKWNY